MCSSAGLPNQGRLTRHRAALSLNPVFWFQIAFFTPNLHKRSDKQESGGGYLRGHYLDVKVRAYTDRGSIGVGKNAGNCKASDAFSAWELMRYVSHC